MPVILWDEASPPDDESVGLGDDRIRSLKSSVRVGLDSEHVWPAAGGDAGVHRFGSARPYYGAQSLVSSSGSDGRLMVTSNTSRLFGVGSGGTVFFGGATVISAGTFPGDVAQQRSIWVEEFGEGQIKSAATTVTIPGGPYQGLPYIWLTPLQDVTISGDTPVFLYVDSGQARSTTQFGVDNRDATNTRVSSVSFFWRSLGTKAL